MFTLLENFMFNVYHEKVPDVFEGFCVYNYQVHEHNSDGTKMLSSPMHSHCRWYKLTYSLSEYDHDPSCRLYTYTYIWHTNAK